MRAPIWHESTPSWRRTSAQHRDSIGGFIAVLKPGRPASHRFISLNPESPLGNIMKNLLRLFFLLTIAVITAFILRSLT
jgi:hypothetical protein